MTRPFFTKDRISHFENFDRHADEAINQIKARFLEGYAVDIQVSLSLSQTILSTSFSPYSIIFNFFLPSNLIGRSRQVHPRLSHRIPIWQ